MYISVSLCMCVCVCVCVCVCLMNVWNVLYIIVGIIVSNWYCTKLSWKWKSLSCVQFFVTPWTVSMEFSRPKYWSGSLSLLQGIFPTQGSNPGLPHCRWILYQLSHKGSPRILEWVAYPFSRESSWPRNQTSISCIAGDFFTNRAMREAHKIELNKFK